MAAVWFAHHWLRRDFFLLVLSEVCKTWNGQCHDRGWRQSCSIFNMKFRRVPYYLCFFTVLGRSLCTPEFPRTGTGFAKFLTLIHEFSRNPAPFFFQLGWNRKNGPKSRSRPSRNWKIEILFLFQMNSGVLLIKDRPYDRFGRPRPWCHDKHVLTATSLSRWAIHFYEICWHHVELCSVYFWARYFSLVIDCCSSIFYRKQHLNISWFCNSRAHCRVLRLQR